MRDAAALGVIVKIPIVSRGSGDCTRRGQLHFCLGKNKTAILFKLIKRQLIPLVQLPTGVCPGCEKTIVIRCSLSVFCFIPIWRSRVGGNRGE